MYSYLKPVTVVFGHTHAIDTQEEYSIDEYGNEKSLHLNFHAEETLSQINDLLENALNWLLNEHMSEKVLSLRTN